jgi:hypothetical protein
MRAFDSTPRRSRCRGRACSRFPSSGCGRAARGARLAPSASKEGSELITRSWNLRPRLGRYDDAIGLIAEGAKSEAAPRGR